MYFATQVKQYQELEKKLNRKQGSHPKKINAHNDMRKQVHEIIETADNIRDRINNEISLSIVLGILGASGLLYDRPHYLLWGMISLLGSAVSTGLAIKDHYKGKKDINEKVKILKATARSLKKLQRKESLNISIL